MLKVQTQRAKGIDIGAINTCSLCYQKSER